MPRETRVEVLLPAEILERVRTVAFVRNFRRRRRGVAGKSADVSAFVRSLLSKLQPGAGLMLRLARTGRDAASLVDRDEEDSLVRCPIRMSDNERERLDELARAAGVVRGGRGDASAFLRAVIRFAINK